MMMNITKYVCKQTSCVRFEIFEHHLYFVDSKLIEFSYHDSRGLNFKMKLKTSFLLSLLILS